jgi:hypothetical protein
MTPKCSSQKPIENGTQLILIYPSNCYVVQLKSTNVSSWFLAWLILPARRWRQHVPLKRLMTFTGLHIIIAQKTELFIATAVLIFSVYL